MKRIGFVVVFTLFISLSFSQYPMLNIDEDAPMTKVKMKDVSGKMVSLEDAKMENGLLVIFSCNSCPFVLAWEDRYPGLKELTEKNKLGMILLNSNSAKRNGDESYEEMKQHALDQAYTSYYVLDEESKLANAFGAKTTPHVFLLNKDDAVVYEGSIDDNHKSAKDVKQSWLNDAIVNLASGKKISPEKTRATGCGIKR